MEEETLQHLIQSIQDFLGVLVVEHQIKMLQVLLDLVFPDKEMMEVLHQDLQVAIEEEVAVEPVVLVVMVLLEMVV